MIVVIADDLSGATELASAAVEAGLTAEVQTGNFEKETTADLVAISTESRQPTQQLAQVEAIALQISLAKPNWIYKKTDSVLRGHVAPEIATILDALGYTNSLLIPANPKKGRTISDGAYFIAGTPLHLTAFANDPDFPRNSCDVVELARGGGRDDEAKFPVYWLGNAPVPDAKGIFLPEMKNSDAMMERAKQVDRSQTLPAGGVEFFEALLGKAGNPHAFPSSRQHLPTLFVCGSAAAWEMGRSEQFGTEGIPVAAMPLKYFESPDEEFDLWLQRTTRLLEQSIVAAIAIGDFRGDATPAQLLEPLSRLTQAIVEQGAATRLFVEGGATAAAIINKLGWSRLQVKTPLASGIAELSPLEGPSCSIAIKPGSYPWPFSEIQMAP